MIKELPAYATPLALGISFFIETSSWWIRISASKENIGLYISRSNIYLYGGRFFALIFGVLLALQIESGTASSEIALLFGVSFMVSFILQISVLNRTLRVFVLRNISKLLSLTYNPRNNDQISEISYREQKYLFIATLIATSLFSIGISLPLFVASIFVENRLVLSNLGQLINAFGMIVLLFFVDQKLYSAFDGGNLFRTVQVYSTARAIAFLLVATLYVVVYLVMP